MNKKSTNFNCHILVGLPGSGKTYFAESNFPNMECFRTNKFHVNMDDCVKTGDLHNDLMEVLNNDKYAMKEIYCYGVHSDVDICIDGLITTKEQVYQVIDGFLEYLEKNASNIINYTVTITIHQWLENREACVHNDAVRVKLGGRKDSSEISIRNLKFDYIFKTDISQRYKSNQIVTNIYIIRHNVKWINTYDTIFFSKVGDDMPEYHGGPVGFGEMTKTKYMYSETWSGGGTWGNCWGESGDISPEAPIEFKEFDEFLYSICPKISMLQYKMLRNNCVDVETSKEFDYYGGSEDVNRWRCDMEKLYSVMLDMGLVGSDVITTDNKVEDIQNRVRNHLSSITTLINVVRDLIGNDDEKKSILLPYIKRNDLCSIAERDVNWFISLGRAMDEKINDNSFDVENYIKNLV